MRVIGAVVAVMASTSLAQAIGGTVTASYLDSMNGIPRVQVDVNLTCSLVCDSAAPTKHFVITSGVRSKYAAAPTEYADFTNAFSTDLDPDGQASAVSTSFKPGQSVFLEGKGASCHCGNRIGEGGFIDLTTPTLVIPARIGTETTVRAGYDVYFTVEADLRGTEQVELAVSGGGLSKTRSFGKADLNQEVYAVDVLRFTSAGTATVTATLRPSGITSTATWTVTAGNTSGTGGGGGSSSTGGGNGGGGETNEPMGCTAFAGPAFAALALLVIARARRG